MVRLPLSRVFLTSPLPHSLLGDSCHLANSLSSTTSTTPNPNSYPTPLLLSSLNQSPSATPWRIIPNGSEQGKTKTGFDSHTQPLSIARLTKFNHAAAQLLCALIFLLLFFPLPSGTLPFFLPSFSPH
ncbi:hypothetical protein BDV59DRAFT_182858 [Aspergillus ambiguus]|uniref:uncharacterized protein n=1 Tax=Aspergillus ambiguus TaxID=176160 RepID=UPI003CCCF04B